MTIYGAATSAAISALTALEGVWGNIEDEDGDTVFVAPGLTARVSAEDGSVVVAGYSGYKNTQDEQVMNYPRPNAKAF